MLMEFHMFTIMIYLEIPRITYIESVGLLELEKKDKCLISYPPLKDKISEESKAKIEVLR